MVQFYGLSDVFWTLKQMLNHVKLLKDSTFIMVKKYIQWLVRNVKSNLVLRFFFFSYSNVGGAPVAR